MQQEAGGDDHQRGAGVAVTQAWCTCQEVKLRIARHLRPGTTLIDASTIGSQAVEEVAALPPRQRRADRRAGRATSGRGCNGGKGRTEASAMEPGKLI
jgi:hypothetical protein